MCRNWITYCCVLVFSIMLLSAAGGAEQPGSPPPPSMAQPPSTLPEQTATVAQRSREGPDAAGAVAYPSPNSSSAWTSESMATVMPPWTGSPLAYSASRSEAALRIEDLMRGAAARRKQGSFSKAMALYNEALTIAPLYAEGYRQRALTLVRLGDRVQAQVDYNRYLALDPQAPAQTREEVVLFEQSGRARPGEAAAAFYSYGPTTITGASGEPPTTDRSLLQLAAIRFSWARDAFQSGDYDSALLWATNSNRDVPQARTRA